MLTNDVSSNDSAVSGTQKYIQRARRVSKMVALSTIIFGGSLCIGWISVECIKKGGFVNFQWKDYITLTFSAQSQAK